MVAGLFNKNFFKTHGCTLHGSCLQFHTFRYVNSFRRSVKQSSIADSTMEAEYIADSEAAKEAVWLKNFLMDLEVVPSMQSAIILYCDNNGAVANSKEPRTHKKGKHIERKYHLIREKVNRGDTKVSHIASEDNLADPFTKGLTQKIFDHLVEGMEVRCIAT